MLNSANSSFLALIHTEVHSNKTPVYTLDLFTDELPSRFSYTTSKVALYTVVVVLGENLFTELNSPSSFLCARISDAIPRVERCLAKLCCPLPVKQDDKSHTETIAQ